MLSKGVWWVVNTYERIDASRQNSVSESDDTTECMRLIAATVPRHRPSHTSYESRSRVAAVNHISLCAGSHHDVLQSHQLQSSARARCPPG